MNFDTISINGSNVKKMIAEGVAISSAIFQILKAKAFAIISMKATE